MSEFMIALAAVLVGGIGVAWLLVLWAGETLSRRRSAPGGGCHPITGPKDQVAIYDTTGPFIPMPDRLKSHAEMVDWMTKEMPRLMSETQRSR